MADERAHYRRRSSSSVITAGGQHTKRLSLSHKPTGSDTTPSSSDFEMDSIRSSAELGHDEESGLTHANRGKRKGIPRDNSTDPQSAQDFLRLEAKLTRAALLRTTLINAILVALWYGFSISISVYNTWMFSDKQLNFHFPLFTTSLHMVVQFSLASLALLIFPRFRPTASHAHTPLDESTADSLKPLQDSSKPLMTKTFYLTRIAPCGTATALDIGLGNFSLRFITLTFFTMCKSSVLLFVLFFALLFRLESPSWRLGLIITVMTGGVVMMVAGETAFSAPGFVLVMSACFCSGFRWSLTQILLLRNPATSNPFSTLFFLTPVMFLALFVLAIPIEGLAALGAGLAGLSETKGLPLSVAIMLFPGFLAFLMVSAEFALLKRTSVVTLSVCGIFKEVLTISTAGKVFGDTMSPIKISGLIVTILAIAAYNWLKYDKLRAVAKQEAEVRAIGLLDEAEAGVTKLYRSLSTKRRYIRGILEPTVWITAVP
ncbi:hypothetical protein B0A48_15072 [Cryoendolithus antarcticus]|uniref:Sugar phosphate transporter domain-containing protein n=1 Tax=Cryoendolithus antarcticus TaxID=1507870 RepID=A0A1V8SJH0_9PEZI|nr:hypothetical protein B0A48_15072 [Cryoendolithus antarcticus]